MSDITHTEYRYEVHLQEERRICDHAPSVYVTLTQQITTTTRHPDRSTTTHETEPRPVATWTYTPEETP